MSLLLLHYLMTSWAVWWLGWPNSHLYKDGAKKIRLEEASAAYMAAEALHMSSDMASSSGAEYPTMAFSALDVLRSHHCTAITCLSPDSWQSRPLAAHCMILVVYIALHVMQAHSGTLCFSNTKP